MKKLIVLFAIGILGLSSSVKADVPDYVVTAEGAKFYEKVRYSIPSGIVGIDGTSRDRFAAGDVLVYRKDGRIYEKMPVVVNNQKTGRYIFMEVVTCRNGLKVYRHTDLSGPNFMARDEYLVFRNGEFVVKFDEKNSGTLNEFFLRPQVSIAEK